MRTTQNPAPGELRIGAEEVKARLQSDVPITFLDVRNDRDWESSPVKIQGAIRGRPAGAGIDYSGPKNRLTVVY